MADHRPRPYVSQREGIGFTGWAVAIVFAMLAVAGLSWAIAPNLLGQVIGLVHRQPAEAPRMAKKFDTTFADLYQRYGMAPLEAEIAVHRDVHPMLAALQKEPCDRQVIYKASAALGKAHAMRASAEILKGFGQSCPDANNGLYRASELYFSIGDYDEAVRLSSEVIRRQPDVPPAYYVRGRALQGLHRYAAALDDYVTLIRLLPSLKAVRAEVFTRMSESYEAMDRPCEAIGPLQTFIAINPEQRTVVSLERRITELATKGNCALRYAQGTARIVRRSAGVPIAKAEINGVSGTFALDTGASFVTLSPSFAAKAKPTRIKEDRIELLTGNGNTSATLATADVVKLSGLVAMGVPAIVLDKDVGEGLDGLLGMSFLSRFTIVIEDNQMKLTAKTLTTSQ